MKNKFRKTLSLVIAAAMLCGMTVFPVSAGTNDADTTETTETTETVTTINGGETVGDGTYQLSEKATGTITVKEGAKKVTIIGNGAVWDKTNDKGAYGKVSSTPNTNLYIDCKSAAGITLTLKDVYISNGDGSDAGYTEEALTENLINFSGKGNTLVFDGCVILDHDGKSYGKAGIHVPVGSELNIYGTSGSSLFMYKHEQGAGIGGNEFESCGNINFGKSGGANDFYVFAKGSKQGAVIGNGANESETPGDITILSGIYNMEANARGALIGGSAGSGSGAAGNVYVKGGLLDLTVDFSGAAIGGGGYDSGNDKGGGNVYISGGSVRAYITENAKNNWNVDEAGVNEKAITANKVDASGNPVYQMVVPTGEKKSSYTVKVDGKEFYTGPRYGYKYGGTLTDTPGNWQPTDEETNLYLYVTGKNHKVDVNGTKYNAVWDSENNTFTLSEITGDEYVLGDINNDGNINTVDASMLYRYTRKMITLNETQMLAADVNGDGTVNAMDSAVLYRYARKVITVFPAGSSN